VPIGRAMGSFRMHRGVGGAVVLLLLAASFPLAIADVGIVPRWEPTYNMARSTIVMPCNQTGFTDPKLMAKFGIADFDWSNAKVAWSSATPMDCEERLVTQAEMVKAVNPSARIFVYRNLVKALPWYTSVREKMLDPQYSGWFLPFKQGGAFPNGTWHVPACSTDASGTKCSKFYHDQEQTPHPPLENRFQQGEWFIYNNTNDVSGLRPGWHTITDGGRQPTWEACRAAADVAGRRIFCWWINPKATNGTCWFSDEWSTQRLPGEQGQLPFSQKGHVSGYRPSPGETPPPAAAHSKLCSSGVCDCGKGLPCGEYLWDHRNQSLRQWLVSEFILGKETGLGNPNVDGFFLDDGWTNKPNPVPSWAPPTYRQCDMASHGGATEEDYNCAKDMGLSAQDTTDITGNWSQTVVAVKEAALKAGGFTWPQFYGRGAMSLDLDDPRPKCATYMRSACKTGSAVHESALQFDFTRKKFHDPFPLPFIVQDVATFLLVRGPFAWLGFSWMGCNTADVAQYLWPKELDVDYGYPVDEYCHETGATSGVFVREWTKASVLMDCNTWNATITMKRADGVSESLLV